MSSKQPRGNAQLVTIFWTAYTSCEPKVRLSRLSPIFIEFRLCQSPRHAQAAQLPDASRGWEESHKEELYYAY